MKKIKRLSIVLAMVMVLSAGTALCAQAAEIPANSPDTIQTVQPRAITRRYVIVEGLRIRTNPDLNSTVVGLLYKGNNDWFDTDYSTVDGSGRLWYHVVNTSTGITYGWVSATV